MDNLLFVYGTLMNNIQSTIATYLHHNSDFVGEGTFPGKLYDLGSYPGAVYDRQSDSRVHGHVFKLHDPGNMLQRLDLYEGIYPSQADKNEYRRALVSVYVNEEPIDCWVYLYNLSTIGLKEIPAGNYLDYIQYNKAHQTFIQNN